MTVRNSGIPVVDLFAGPGGLAEGFSAVRCANGERAFSIALSIEKDEWAHQTLQLRAWRRRWPDLVPKYYHEILASPDPLARIKELQPREASVAFGEPVRLELGVASVSDVRSLVKSRLDTTDAWVLVGGPPCQAYSLIGRSRNKGNRGYRPDTDHRQKLYVEYLQVLADHAPPVFVMENVKGLLSAQLAGERLFRRIREDLENPAVALMREGRTALQRPRYTIRSLSTPRSLFSDLHPADFVVRAEDHGVPQARHRVILLGVREDIRDRDVQYLVTTPNRATVGGALGDLPRLRSGLSSLSDSPETWLEVLQSAPSRPWFRTVPSKVQSTVRDRLKLLRLPRANRGADRVLTRTNGGTAVLNHGSRSHIVADLDRYLFASCFAEANGTSPTLGDFPALLIPEHRSARRKDGKQYFADRFRVQLRSRPSSTITSHIAKDGHYYIHHDPSQCRSLTVREAARLQTFPDDYFFCGPRTAQYAQVGNAVPPALAAQIAEIVAGILGRG